MELTERQKDALLEFQEQISQVKGEIAALQEDLEGLEEAYLEVYPVSAGDRIQYHDREWMVLKVTVEQLISTGKVFAWIHLVRPTRNGELPKNRVDGDVRIVFSEIGEPKPEKFTL